MRGLGRYRTFTIARLEGSALSRLQHQGQPQPEGPVDLPRARHALLRADPGGGALLHGGGGPGGRVPEGNRQVTPSGSFRPIPAAS